jgi:polyhydroxyalkanoate synthesis regulator phasin
MAQGETWKRYLEAGVAFTEMTRARAEALVKEWVKAGEVPRKRAEEIVEQLVEQGRRNTEAIVALVQAQVREQLAALGIATRDDIARLEAKIEAVRPSAGTAKKAAAGAAKAAKKAAKATRAQKKA